jgi:hypothetical protein
MPEHTPGPWFCGNATSHSDKVYSRRPGDNVRLVANCEQHGWIPSSRAENQANARLIAAAPELLDTLDLLLCCISVNGPDVGIISDPHTIRTIRKARTDVAKATGEETTSNA